MLRTAFKLPLHQTEGLMASVLTLINQTTTAPDHTAVSRRAVALPVIQPASVPDGPLQLLIDNTGCRFTGKPMAGGEAQREIAAHMAQAASRCRCRHPHDRGANPHRSGHA
jgi:hypothetical protein